MKTQTYENLQGVYAISDALHIKALAWLNRNHGNYLDSTELFKQCAGHLRDYADVSDHTAERIAGRAVAEFESRGLTYYIDINESTSTQIALRDSRSGVVHFLSLRKLAALTGLLPDRTAH